MRHSAMIKFFYDSGISHFWLGWIMTTVQCTVEIREGWNNQPHNLRGLAKHSFARSGYCLETGDRIIIAHEHISGGSSPNTYFNVYETKIPTWRVYRARFYWFLRNWICCKKTMKKFGVTFHDVRTEVADAEAA